MTVQEWIAKHLSTAPAIGKEQRQRISALLATPA